MTEVIVTAGAVLAEPGREPLRDGAVLVRDREIVSVGTLEETRALASAGVAVISHPTTSTLLPGLIDAHVRLVLGAGMSPYKDFQTADPDALPDQMAQRAQTALRAGLTTIRDVGDTRGLAIELSKQVASGQLAGPRVIAAGAPLTIAGGDAAFLGGAVEGDEQIRAAIRDRAEAGAALICYHDSGGWLRLAPGAPNFWDTQFSRDQVELIVTEASRHGLPVAAHVHSKQGIVHAVEAGVTTIEQCTWSIGDEQFERDDTVATAMAKQGIAVCIPSGRNRRFVIAKYGEQEAIEQWYYRYPWLEQHGVRLVPGSSAGSTGAQFDDYVSGLETYEWMGFSLTRILELATREAAAVLGLEKITGALSPGYSADLLVVDGDPLNDLQALRRVQFVMAEGRIASDTGQPH